MQTQIHAHNVLQCCGLFEILIHCLFTFLCIGGYRNPLRIYKNCLSGAFVCSHLFDNNPTQITADIWYTGWVVIVPADDFPPSFKRVSHTAICYSLDQQLSWKLMFHPSILPPPSLSSVPFSSSQWSTETANLIKLTTIKIRLNYCKPLHWYPISILN